MLQAQKILQPFTHILQIPGSQGLSKLVQGFNYWLKVPVDKLIAAGEIGQIIQNSSILIDDIENYATPSRGIPVQQSVHEVAKKVNDFCYMYFTAGGKVLKLNNSEAFKVFTEEMLELHRGQGMDLYWRENFICPSVEEYTEMTKKKTGGQLRVVTRLVQAFSENKTDFSKLTDILALYSQIFNDYRNLLPEYSEEKRYCEDIAEGKFSFPIIHAIKSRPDDSQVLNILQRRTKDLEVKKYFVTLLEKFGSFSQTRHTLDVLNAEARAEVAELGGNPLLEDLLDELLKWKGMTDEKKQKE